ncbi:AAA family ATPase [Escherichia coli]
MKNNVKFKNIKILSLRDRKAFSYEFSEGVNFIYGTNDVGKSSLIKSLYYTLGGDLRLDDAWKSDDIVTLVEINNGENDFIFLRYKKIIGVFDLKNDNLVVYNTISSLASHVQIYLVLNWNYIINIRVLRLRQTLLVCLPHSYLIRMKDGKR